jgi:hypothetical protein
MEQLLNFVRQDIRPSDLIFADSQSGMLLAHYLCRQQPVSMDESPDGYGTFECGGRRVLETVNVFFFTKDNFLPRWSELPQRYGLKDGDTVWVVQVGWLWEDTLAKELQRNLPQFHDLTPMSFGHNMTVFKLTVRSGQRFGAGCPTPSTALRADPARFSQGGRGAIVHN